MALENIVYAATGKLGRRLRGAGSSRLRSAWCTVSASHSRCANPCSSPATTWSPRCSAFNVGVEIGQIAVLLVLIPALNLLFRYVVVEWLGVIILSALVAHVGWHWMIERGGESGEIPVSEARRGVPGQRDARADGRAHPGAGRVARERPAQTLDRCGKIPSNQQAELTILPSATPTEILSRTFFARGPAPAGLLNSLFATSCQKEGSM